MLEELDGVGLLEEDGRALLDGAAEEDGNGSLDGRGSPKLEGISFWDDGAKEETPSDDGVKTAEEDAFVGVPQPANKNKTKPKVNRFFILIPPRESVHYR